MKGVIEIIEENVNAGLKISKEIVLILIQALLGCIR